MDKQMDSKTWDKTLEKSDKAMSCSPELLSRAYQKNRRCGYLDRFSADFGYDDLYRTSCHDTEQPNRCRVISKQQWTRELPSMAFLEAAPTRNPCVTDTTAITCLQYNLPRAYTVNGLLIGPQSDFPHCLVHSYRRFCLR